MSAAPAARPPVRPVVVAGAAAVLVLAVGACGAEASWFLDPESAGGATVAVDGPEAFGRPVANADAAGRVAFDVGNDFFRAEWQPAPGPDETDGLGPRFNATSCVACHVADGRSRGPDAGPVTDPGLIVFLAAGFDERGVPSADPVYGTQIQDRAIESLAPEARIRVEYEEVAGLYADGTSYTLRRPTVLLEEPALGDPVSTISARVAPPLIGLGLLDAIPDASLVASADPGDADGDGISGRMPPGRFGWKGSVTSLREQTLLALYHDIGITSAAFPTEDCLRQEECAGLASGGRPEVGEGRIGALVTYLRLLAVPARRDLDDPAVVAGARSFATAGCDRCHRPEFVTGDTDIPALARQEIHPFTDLLLHDMGDGLAGDGPGGAEWRTPPLWGIGLTGVVGGHTTFLHDGRARSLEEAILWHGGEAAAARDAFVGMSSEERDALIAFLRSL